MGVGSVCCACGKHTRAVRSIKTCGWYYTDGRHQDISDVERGRGVCELDFAARMGWVTIVDERERALWNYFCARTFFVDEISRESETP